MNGIIINKTWSGGSDKALVLPPQRGFCRKTGLPPNWKRCRISLTIGITNLTEDTGMPVEEVVNATSEALTYHIGLVDTATGFPGSAGVKFVGLSNAPGRQTVCMKYISEIPAWAFCHSGWWGLSGAATIGNGVSVSRGGDSSAPGGVLSATPNGSSGFFTNLNVDIKLADDGKLYVYSTSGGVDDRAAGPGLVGLNAGLSLALSEVGNVGGGWWANSAPVGCQYLFVRFPFFKNRVTLYGIKVMQLA